MTIVKEFGKSKQQIAIFKPLEMKMFLKAIPKYEHQIMVKALLYSGMRYVEAQRLQENPNWFDGQFIKMNAGKPKAQMIQRYIHLNPQGREVISSFVNLKCKLPTTVTFRENIRRWGKKANIDTEGLCPKSFRKTYESWLVWYYPEKQLVIMQSQGHDSVTSIQHYLNLAFTDEDRIYMKEFVDGWT
jgi:integrase